MLSLSNISPPLPPGSNYKKWHRREKVTGYHKKQVQVLAILQTVTLASLSKMAAKTNKVHINYISSLINGQYNKFLGPVEK